MRRTLWIVLATFALTSSYAVALPRLPGVSWGETFAQLSASVGTLHSDPHDNFQTLQEGLAYLDPAQNGQVVPVSVADRTGVQHAYWAVSSGGPIKFYLLHGQLIAYKVSYYQRSVFTTLVRRYGSRRAKLMYPTFGGYVWSAAWRLSDSILVWQRQLADGYPFESTVYIWPGWFDAVSARVAATLTPPAQGHAHPAPSSRPVAAKN